MKSYIYFQFQVLSVAVVRLSYEYSNMTLKSPTYCDRTWCVVIFFRKSNSESISNPNSKIQLES